MEIDLRGVTFASDEIGGGDSSSSIESLSLNYTAMQYAFQSTTAGLTGTISAHNWDLTNHVADYSPATILPKSGLPAAIARSTGRPAANRRIALPVELARAVAVDARIPSARAEAILNGNLTALLTIPGILGTSTVPGYTHASEISGYSVGTSSGFSGTAPPVAQPLSYSKSVDLNSPTIWSLVAQRTPYSGGTSAELDLVDTTTTPATPKLKGYFILGNPPYPESYQFSGSVGSVPAESSSIFYTRLVFCVVPDSSAVIGSVCHGYDYLTNQPI